VRWLYEETRERGGATAFFDAGHARRDCSAY
jgi:hypothetical protein